MAKNKLSDLRDHLFETIESLKDPEKPMDIERARAISVVAQTIIETAKVEVDMVKAIEANHGSDFFGDAAAGRRALLEQPMPKPNGKTVA